MKSMGVYYWYVKMPPLPWCRCVEHGFDIMFYVQKQMAPQAALFWSPAGSWLATRGACICETCLLACIAAYLEYTGPVVITIRHLNEPVTQAMVPAMSHTPLTVSQNQQAKTVQQSRLTQ